MKKEITQIGLQFSLQHLLLIKMEMKKFFGKATGIKRD